MCALCMHLQKPFKASLMSFFVIFLNGRVLSAHRSHWTLLAPSAVSSIPLFKLKQVQLFWNSVLINVTPELLHSIRLKQFANRLECQECAYYCQQTDIYPLLLLNFDSTQGSTAWAVDSVIINYSANHLNCMLATYYHATYMVCSCSLTYRNPGC